MIRGNSPINKIPPFVLIDGIPGNIDSLNPQNIESIKVLKDVEAIAAYGMQGAPGVILVTTQKKT
ncbi:MAG TPA: hypothetical protein VGB84_05900 [Arachidicoccus sp.]